MIYIIGKCLLRDRLKDAHMTQLELAERLQVKEQQINKYVNDRQGMSLKVAKNISAVLNCRIEDLYKWIEVGNNK